MRKRIVLITLVILIFGFLNTVHADNKELYKIPSIPENATNYNINNPVGIQFESGNLEIKMKNIRNSAMRTFLYSILPFILTFCLIIGSILLVLGILFVVLSRKNTSLLIWGRNMIYGSISLILISRYIYPFIFPEVRIY